MVELNIRGKSLERIKYITLSMSCIILAGGKSLRLGHDKVLETVGDKSLLQQAIAGVSSLCDEIIIVTDRERAIPQLTSRRKVKMAVDIFPGKGPLGGIYTGLTVSDSYYNLAIACDMPFLNQALLGYMIQLTDGFDVVIPRTGNMVEPLHAVYAKGCMGPIEDMIKRDNLNLYELLDMVKVRYVEADEIDKYDPEHLSFFNINTKADLEIARQLARGSGSDDKR